MRQAGVYRCNMIEISTELYKSCREPGGRGRWGFRLVSASVTHHDKLIWSDLDTPYDKALAEAQRIATLRRSPQIVVLPGIA
jgi:hypothetical protein